MPWDWSGAFTGVAGQLRVTYNSGQYTVQGDLDGDGAADLQITAFIADPLGWLTGGQFIL